ncbi:unnamed protein product [Rotaria magnacalcarata]|uniref:Glutamine amidotransferase type-2 domain-containing protein n=1 Tax=Rotaria magnacalcarata TaxID=392030 RepID=A0A816QVU4_9BILA|nr:unnamed protein product [Rotaria magnacalcarata]
MCRWFANIGEEPILLEDVLIKPKHSIAKQIDVHFLPNLHVTYDPHLHQRTLSSGGYYTGVATEFNDDKVNRPCVYKNVRPPLNDFNLISLCAHTSSKCVFAHIRAATSLSSAVETNNHPFVFGRQLFMHNGMIPNFLKIKVTLLQKLSEKVSTNIFGTTDTEHVAALFFTHLGNDWDAELPIETLNKTMIKTLQDVLSLIQETTKDNNETLLHSSLNFVVTDSC